MKATKKPKTRPDILGINKSFSSKLLRGFIISYKLSCLPPTQNVITKEWFCKKDQILTDRIYKLIYQLALTWSNYEKQMLIITILILNLKSSVSKACN